MERAVLFADGARIRLEDLAEEVRSAPDDPRAADVRGAASPASSSASEESSEPASSDGDGLKEQVKAAMSKLERELIFRALQQTQNNVTHAARLLKISRKGLQLKMKELGLRERESD